ncbi:hypothetical protein, partial [Novipirellula maiorica]|uniref:hypothetical protein n=1 Tax=Novipirellula maiorica TaxID=1265734 RepID=UPI000593772A
KQTSLVAEMPRHGTASAQPRYHESPQWRRATGLPDAETTACDSIATDCHRRLEGIIQHLECSAIILPYACWTAVA